MEALGGAANGGDEVSAAGAADGSADGEICGECETGEGADDGGGGDGRGEASAQPVVAPAPSPLTRQPSWCNTEQGGVGARHLLPLLERLSSGRVRARSRWLSAMRRVLVVVRLSPTGHGTSARSPQVEPLVPPESTNED